MNAIACRNCNAFGDVDACLDHVCHTRGESWLVDRLLAERNQAVRLAAQTRGELERARGAK